METRHFAGHEPFDLLNSPWLQARWARRTVPAVLLMQFGKRYAGMRLRKWLAVPPSRNPKALGLALAAYCDLARCGYDVAGVATHLRNALRELRSPGEKDFCWGYDWDYVSLRGSRLAAYAPNSIATCFCAQALLDASEVWGDEEALAMGESAARFLVTRLNHSFDSGEAICYSYTPNDRTVIYNSSALAGALLARVGSLCSDSAYLAEARKAMVFLERAQLPDGGWFYGQRRRQRWIDGFHTSYNVCALADYQRHSGDRSFEDGMLRGHRYYRDTFFTPEGAPRYFHNRTFPIDIHACSQALIHFTRFAEPAAAVRTFRWIESRMAGPGGFFYYQRHFLWTNRTPYMRWGQAWMLRALASLLGSRAEGR